VLVEFNRKKLRPYTDTIIKRTGLSQAVVHERLEDLCLLKICDKKPHAGDKNSYGLTQEFQKLIEGVDFGHGTPTRHDKGGNAK
jgi:hypothetical protein